MRKHYVLGLVFNYDHSEILLVEKLRPDWQKGRWNGIGGKIEEEETPGDAMLRECGEETDHKYDFEHKILFTCPGGTVYVYAATGTGPHIRFTQVEDEKLQAHKLYNLPTTMMANMRWIIPLCLANVQFPIMITQNCLGVDG